MPANRLQSGTQIALELHRGWKAVVQDPSTIEDLFPSAAALFHGRRRRLPLFAWVIAAALAVLLGRELLSWVDHNI